MACTECQRIKAEQTTLALLLHGHRIKSDMWLFFWQTLILSVVKLFFYLRKDDL